MVLKGNDCDLVVGDKNNTNVFLVGNPAFIL